MGLDFKCVVCDKLLGLTWLVDHFDERICRKCSNHPRCWSCSAITGGTGMRAETVLPDGRSRCARCSKWAVDQQSDVGSVVQLVRPLLHSYGVRLPNQVRVELVEPSELHADAGEFVRGQTVMEQDCQGGASRVRGIRVISGMPATQFGKVVAHEMGHGWLTLCPGSRPPAAEEGICELIGSWWLQHRGGPLAAHYLTQMMKNPDPTYGDGYRSACHRAGDSTPTEVVRRIATTGRL